MTRQAPLALLTAMGNRAGTRSVETSQGSGLDVVEEAVAAGQQTNLSGDGLEVLIDDGKLLPLHLCLPLRLPRSLDHLDYGGPPCAAPRRCRREMSRNWLPVIVRKRPLL